MLIYFLLVFDNIISQPECRSFNQPISLPDIKIKACELKVHIKNKMLRYILLVFDNIISQSECRSLNQPISISDIKSCDLKVHIKNMMLRYILLVFDNISHNRILTHTKKCIIFTLILYIFLYVILQDQKYQAIRFLKYFT